MYLVWVRVQTSHNLVVERLLMASSSNVLEGGAYDRPRFSNGLC